MERDAGPEMILAEWLFVETVADLRDRCHEPEARSRYERLGIAPLLRKLLLLLLDKSSLLIAVNRGGYQPALTSPSTTWCASAVPSSSATPT